MCRLTQKDDQGNWCLKGLPWEQLHVGQVITTEVSEKLYGALWRLMEYEDTGLSPQCVERLNDFEKTQTAHCLAALQEEQRKHQWIPVAERLPDQDDMVLVTCRTKKGMLSVNRAYLSNGFWHGSGTMSGVIAWMLLPEPYQPTD